MRDKKRTRIKRCLRVGGRAGPTRTTSSEGRVINDEQSGTATRRRRQREGVMKRVIARRKRGGTVRRVGTGKRSGAMRKGRENIEGVERVREYWVSGMLTNERGLAAQFKAGATGKKRTNNPSLVVLRNVETQSIVRHEARLCGIPTVGRETSAIKGEAVRNRTYARPWYNITMDAANYQRQGLERRVSRRKQARRKEPRGVTRPRRKVTRRTNSKKPAA
jgi:ribosomal protein S2